MEGNFLKTLELSPDFAERVRSATRVDRFHGSPVPNFFRKPYGPGWALVGDAGYTKDPITAQGISNAFRDAELCAEALDATFAGATVVRRRHGRATRPTATPTRCRCTSSPPNSPPSSRRRPSCSSSSAAIHGNQPAMDAFVSVTAGTALPRRVLRPRQHRSPHGATGHEPLKPGSRSV